MKSPVPCKVSQEEIILKAEELEATFQSPPLAQKPFPPCCITLKGKTMVIREAKVEELPLLCQYLRQVMDSPQFAEGKDFYDIVAARVYSELLGIQRRRLKDPYLFVGLVDGELVALADGRLMNEDINISLHTMAFDRGMRAGACMYFAKCEYCFDILGQEEFWATYESYNGWKRWGFGMAQPSKAYPDMQHELGGAKIFYITKKYWNQSIKNYIKEMVGAEIQRPVPPAILKLNETMRIPKEVTI
jgi:hypothetical protein